VSDAARSLYVDPGRRAVFKRLLEEQNSLHGFESQVYRKNGTMIWVSETVRVVRDGQGTPIFYEGFVEEVTGRRGLEEQFRQAQKMEAVAGWPGGSPTTFNNLTHRHQRVQRGRPRPAAAGRPVRRNRWWR